MRTRTIEIEIPVDEQDLARLRGDLGSRVNTLHERAMASRNDPKLFLELTHRIIILDHLLNQL